MASDPVELLSLLNSSGFPFQIGVRKEIERTALEHRWAVDAEEHHWRHPETNNSGFADLLISHQQLIFSAILECKRVKEAGKWLFLTPRDYAGEKKRISAFCTNIPSGDANPFFGWTDFNFDPLTPEAAYCVFHGQEEKKPMLERIADDLLPAVESVGCEYLQINQADRTSQGEWRLFLPIIVTNATLYTATFDADKVSMASGRLEDACDFKPVPFIRFRKSLTKHYPRVGRQNWHTNSLGRASRAKETTVLVIHSASLADSLKKLDVAANEQGIFGKNLHDLNRQEL